MRRIKKRPPPNALVEWRQKRKTANNDATMPFDYEALRGDKNVMSAVEQSLYAEQGGICAYTGLFIGNQSNPNFHVEHLLPQKYCQDGKDTEYSNLVACWPKPNVSFKLSYGAVYKADWPSPAEEHNFVKPTSAACEAKFLFKSNGKLEPAVPHDKAACMTIKKLNLNHEALKNLRKQKIDGILSAAKYNPTCLKRLLKKYQRAEERLDNREDVKLNCFHFAIKQVLAKKIQSK